MLNCVVLMGRLTADPELRSTQSGTSVARFSIAVDRNSKDKETDFINITAWRQTADFVSKYFKKGSMIALDGELRMNKFTDKNGQNRTTYEVLANRVSFCGGKQDTEVPAKNTQYNEVETPAEDGFPF